MPLNASTPGVVSLPSKLPAGAATMGAAIAIGLAQLRSNAISVNWIFIDPPKRFVGTFWTRAGG